MPRPCAFSDAKLSPRKSKPRDLTAACTLPCWVQGVDFGRSELLDLLQDLADGLRSTMIRRFCDRRISSEVLTSACEKIGR